MVVALRHPATAILPRDSEGVVCVAGTADVTVEMEVRNVSSRPVELSIDALSPLQAPLFGVEVDLGGPRQNRNSNSVGGRKHAQAATLPIYPGAPAHTSLAQQACLDCKEVVVEALQSRMGGSTVRFVGMAAYRDVLLPPLATAQFSFVARLSSTGVVDLQRFFVRVAAAGCMRDAPVIKAMSHQALIEVL